VLRPFLRGWWERAGKPIAGPVFPVRRGKHTGQSRTGRGVSFAGRLRRELFKAGVVRHPPVTDDDGKPVPNPADPIYFDTPVSRRVDFHSFRRAYNTALAGAGVNVQTAMGLASHSDPKTHMRYVMAAESARPVPAAALPMLDPGLAARLLQSPAVTRRHRNDVSNVVQLPVSLRERDTGLEPATFGLGSRRSTN
jgi:integrase